MSLRTQVILWMVIFVMTVLVRTRSHQLSVGLVLAYLTNLWLIHWPAALSYLLPFTYKYDEVEVGIGFEQTLYGIAAFCIGSLIVAPVLMRVIDPPRAPRAGDDRRLPNATLPYVYIGIGIASYLVITPLLGRIPTVAAVSVGLQQMMVPGLCLILWHAWFAKRKRQLAFGMAFALLFPLVTILRQGFLSYGAMALICIVTFMAAFFRPRWLLAIMLLFVMFAGFSFFVTYMRDRTDIRATVWGGQRAGARVGQLSTTLRDFDWFDPGDAEHWARVNSRLNQNVLVGYAVKNLQDETVDYAYGKTVVDGVLSLIPRAIWPQKPQTAGSGTVVTDYTGIKFARGTSVGVGQVMEFYINFGTLGVIIGFLLVGAVVTILDTWAAQRIWEGDWLQFAVWYLPGIALMQAGGSLIEVFSGAGSAIVAVLFVNRYIVSLRIGPPPEIEPASV
ncbi:MAG TPA: hypothetical protein VM100_12260 [Longimicrobiales bacterium]|nr:hypothetical protein [Longimicrobiales bacterium]